MLVLLFPLLLSSLRVPYLSLLLCILYLLSWRDGFPSSISQLRYMFLLAPIFLLLSKCCFFPYLSTISVFFTLTCRRVFT